MCNGPTMRAPVRSGSPPRRHGPRPEGERGPPGEILPGRHPNAFPYRRSSVRHSPPGGANPLNPTQQCAPPLQHGRSTAPRPPRIGRTRTNTRPLLAEAERCLLPAAPGGAARRRRCPSFRCTSCPAPSSRSRTSTPMSPTGSPASARLLEAMSPGGH